MGLFGFLKKNEAEKKIVPKVVEVDEEEVLDRRELSRQRNQQIRERQRLELETIRMEHQLKKIELENTIADARADRDLKNLERRVTHKNLMEDLRDQLGEDDEEDAPDSIESMLVGLLPKIMNKTNTAPSGASVPSPSWDAFNGNPTNAIGTAVSVSPPPSESQDLKSQLLARWQTLSPIDKAYIKQQDDEKIKQFLINQEPTISQEQIKEITAFVRSA